MEGEETSLIRRTKFSRTVDHRLDSARLASVPLTIQREKNLVVKSRTGKAFVDPKSDPIVPQIQRNPALNKHRSTSPFPRIPLSDSFKEARSDLKRFSTPNPRRKEHEKSIMGHLFRQTRPSSSKTISRNSLAPLRHFSSLKIFDEMKMRKESSWTQYFDLGSGRVTSVETSDDWMVDLSELYFGHRFAHGAHSQLYQGIYKDEPVAVKIIQVPDDDQNGALGARFEKQFTREVSLLSRLHHQNVLRFVAACRMPPVFLIITEYLSGGSLRAYLHKLEHQSLPLQKLMAVALEIARGMKYIHSQGVIHRDLKPENVLICEDFHIKIADFGIACEEAYCDLLADDPGTYRWMAPEMIKRKSYGQKVDVYSFGLMLSEMVSGTVPYEEMTPIQAAFAVVNKNLRPTIPGDCPPAMRALIEQCWSLQPENRPDFWQVVKLLEQFETSLTRDGTLNLVQNACQDPKKGILHWIQKFGPMHSHSSSVTKPNFV